ncbi:MAG TPA: ABC transporter permease [Vicinamibacterales bacterium]|nr:ABC transporter permease [Vicinamibacterales bacterium]
MQSLLQDLRVAVRRLVKDKWFTLAAIAALALGIGANSAVFTLVNAVLLRGLPVDDADRIMWVMSADNRGRTFGVSFQDFEDWRASSKSFTGMTLVQNGTMIISGDEPLPESYPGGFISANAFDVIGVKAQFGRGFVADDDKEGAPPVVLISGGIWKTRYASDPNVIGKAIRVNTIPATIVGVMPDGFKWPFQSEVWMPMAHRSPAFRVPRQGRPFMVYGRLAEGTTLEQARSEMKGIAAQLSQQYQDSNKDITAQVTPFMEFLIGSNLRTMFWALMGAVAFVLLIACSNVANLMLARSADRAREVALRVSLGATRSRIIRQLLVESVLLACVSGMVGLGLAYAGIQWFDSESQNIGRPYWMTFNMDASVFVFFAIVCVGTGILFGLAPAIHVSKTNVNDILKEGGRSGSGGVRARRWTAALIVAELTLTLVLLAGAGFMMRSFVNLYQLDIGVDTSKLLTMGFILPTRKYTTIESRVEFMKRMEEALNANAAVAGATTSSNQPLGGGAQRQLELDGKPLQGGEKPRTALMLATGARYFDAMGVRLLRGRTFDVSEGTPGREVAVINQRLAERYFGNADPVGQRIRLIEDNPNAPQYAWATIVGVAPNIRQRQGNQTDPDQDPVVYVPHSQNTGLVGLGNVLVRARSNPAELMPVVRKEIFALDPDLSLAQMRTLDESLAQQRWFPRVFGIMFTVFAGIAIVLAAVGLFAVTAYSVTQRIQEIGIRMALGAHAKQISWLILRRGLIQLAIGLTLGLAGAFGVGRLLQSMLFQIGSADPLTLALISTLLIVVAVTATLWPSWQATRLDPVTALRYE